MFYYITLVLIKDSCGNALAYFFFPSKSYSTSLKYLHEFITCDLAQKLDLIHEPVVKKVNDGFGLEDVPRLIKTLFLEV